MVEEQEEEQEEEVEEKVEDKGGREVTQARVQLHQMQPTGNHSTPFKLVLGALQSIAQIVLYLETKSGGLLFQPVQKAKNYVGFFINLWSLWQQASMKQKVEDFTPILSIYFRLLQDIFYKSSQDSKRRSQKQKLNMRHCDRNFILPLICC